MADNTVVRVIETANFASLEAAINANVTTEAANGLKLQDVDVQPQLDPLDGSVKAMAILVYSKALGSVSDLKPSTGTYFEQSIAPAAPATGFTTALAADTRYILVTIEDADIRVRFDGVDPTAAIGHLYEEGSVIVWSKALAEAARMIRTGAGPSPVVLHVSQLKD